MYHQQFVIEISETRQVHHLTGGASLRLFSGKMGFEEIVFRLAKKRETGENKDLTK